MLMVGLLVGARLEMMMMSIDTCIVVHTRQTLSKRTMHTHPQVTDSLDIANQDCSHVVPNTTQYKRIVGVQSVADITTNTGKDRNAQNGCTKCTIQEAREQ